MGFSESYGEGSQYFVQLEVPIHFGIFPENPAKIKSISPELHANLSFLESIYVVQPFLGVGLGYTFLMQKPTLPGDFPSGFFMAANGGIFWNIPKTGLAITTDAKVRMPVPSLDYSWAVSAGVRYLFGLNKKTTTKTTKKGSWTFDESKIKNPESVKHLYDTLSKNYSEFVDGFYMYQGSSYNYTIKRYTGSGSKQSFEYSNSTPIDYDSYLRYIGVYSRKNGASISFFMDKDYGNYELSNSNNKTSIKYSDMFISKTNLSANIKFDVNEENLRIYKNIFATNNVVLKYGKKTKKTWKRGIISYQKVSLFSGKL